jgi:hypothetical protein
MGRCIRWKELHAARRVNVVLIFIRRQNYLGHSLVKEIEDSKPGRAPQHSSFRRVVRVSQAFKFESKDATAGGREMDCAAGNTGCAVIGAEERGTTTAEVTYGIAAVTVALFLLATAL